MFPAFGMAEATLAVTFPEPGSGLTVDVIDGRVLETEKYAAPVAPSDTRRAPAGPPRPSGRRALGASVRPATGGSMHDREVGEIEIRGTSVTPGYYGRPDATAAAFHDGWLRTGDLGYLVDGELVVCGRIKDVIILGGRNVHPQDVERAIADVDGVRAGNVIAFGTTGRRGREALVVVAEARDADDQDDVRRDSRRRARARRRRHARRGGRARAARARCRRRRRASCSAPSVASATSASSSNRSADPDSRGAHTIGQG